MLVVLLFLAGVLGGALTAVAGGASFVTFPVIVLSGIGPVAANASSAVALWPASLASSWVYRNDIPRDRKLLVTFAILSLLGGGIGSGLLLVTNDTTFAKLLPFLMLLAASVFTFGKRLARRKDGRLMSLPVASVLQLLISIYGGYFGGGMGILMLAVWTLMGMSDMHAMNGLKAMLGALLNAVAIVIFLVAGKVVFTATIPVLVGGLVGAYGAASLARKISSDKIRVFVLFLGWGMTAFFFYRSFIARP